LCQRVPREVLIGTLAARDARIARVALPLVLSAALVADEILDEAHHAHEGALRAAHTPQRQPIALKEEEAHA
jgi:hypothetical protein